VYTFSCYVYDNGTAGVSTTGIIKLKVFQGDGSSAVLADADLLATSDPHTSFPAIDKDPTSGIGWRRMSVTFSSGGVSVIRPAVECTDFTPGKIIFVDGALVEEGSVIRSYTPGTVNSPAVVEGMGVQIDAAAGGKMRLRGSGGGERNVVELGVDGLSFGGSASPANLYSPEADVLASDQQIRSYFSPAFRAETGTSTGGAFRSQAETDTAARFNIRTDGQLTWGDGSAATDTNLYRSAANVLKTDDTFNVPSIVMPGSTSGTITVNPTAAAGTTVLTLPATTGTVALTSQIPSIAGTTFDLTGDVTMTAAALNIGSANSYVVSVDNDSHSHTGATLSAIPGGDINAGSITGTQIAGLTITGANIAAATITAAKIASNTITAAEIAADAIGASELSDTISITTSGTMTPTGTADITGTSGYNSVYMGGSSGVSKRFYRFTGVSEERLKENITPTSLAADAIYGLNPIDFNFRASASELYPNIEFPTTRQWGLTVENAREVFPSAVSGGQNGEPYGIHWERIYFGMLVAIKDLNARVLTLEEKIAELEGRE
jgi:hypothetical protein